MVSPTVSRMELTPDEDGLRRLTLDEFRRAGLLYALNRYVLHPKGLALAIEYDLDKPIGFVVVPADDGVWEFSDELEREGQDKLHAFLLSMLT